MDEKESVLDMSLCDNTAEQLISLNCNIKSLVEYSKLLGTIKDSRSMRTKINKLKNSINDEMFVITTNLKILKQEVTKGDKVIEMQTEKIEENFLNAISKYKEVQKETLKKERYDIHSIIMDINVTNRASLKEDEVKKLHRGSKMLKTLKIEEERLLINQQRILEVNRDFIDIHEIMIQLSDMVHEQGNAIDEINETITQVDVNLETGAQQLRAASDKRWSFSRRSLIFAIGLAAVAIFVIVLSIICF